MPTTTDTARRATTERAAELGRAMGRKRVVADDQQKPTGRVSLAMEEAIAHLGTGFHTRSER